MNSLGPVPPPPAPPGSPPPRPPAIPVAPQTESTGQQSTGTNSGGTQTTPPPPATVPAAVPQPAPAVSVPASLAGVLAGTTIPAEVVTARPDGQIVVQTPNGTAVAQMPNPPPAGSTLTLQIVSATAADVRAMVVAVDDTVVDPPVPLRLTVTGVTAPPAPVDAAAARPTATAPLPAPAPAPLPDLGTVMPARIVAPPAQPLPSAPAGGLPGLPQVMALAGQPLLARIVTLTPPPQFTALATSATVPNTAAPISSATTAATGAPVATPNAMPLPASALPPAVAAPATPAAAFSAAPSSNAPPAAPGSTLNPATALPGAPPTAPTASVMATPRAGTPAFTPATPLDAGVRPAALAATPAASPAAPTPAPTAPALPTSQGLIAAVTLNGFVMASTPNQAVIATPAGTLVVETRGTLPPGTQMTLAVEPAAAAAGGELPDIDAPSTATPTTPRAALLELADGWPALRHALHAAETLNPAAVAAFMNQRLPGLNGRTAANILFFLTALRRGDVGGWLGPELTQTLDRSRERGRLTRLQAEFTQLSQLADAPAGGEWRVLPFPLFDGGTIDPVFLFYRGKRKGKDGAPRDDLRFLVDVKLSQLGALQLDGLVRSKRFDLVIRSHAPMTPAMREDIGRIFTEALGATGMTGDVVFQTVAPFPVSPFAEMMGEGGHGTGTNA